MKKTKLFGLALIATMTSFSACTNDAEEGLTQESEIKLTSEITPSRAASNLQSTQIVAGQEVGVTITGAKTDHNNVAWEVEDNGVLTNKGDAVYYGDGAVTITAYHPFNDDWDENTIYGFSVSTDQSTNAKYLASDLLWATATSSKTETAVPLTFSHKLTKINVTLVPENEDDDLKGATISIYGTKIIAAINPTTGQMLEADGTTQEIIAGVIADDVYTASAIVVPQEVSGKFIKITHEGKTYFYTLPSAKILESGHSYSYTLTVKGKQLISTGSSIDEWDDESGNTGDAEEVDFSWFNPNKYISYVSNYEQITTNDDASKPDIVIYRSYVKCPNTTISKIEIKFQMVDNSYFGTESTPLWVWYGGGISLYDNQMKIGGGLYPWDELDARMTDLFVLSISYKEKYVKLNGVDLEYNYLSDENFRNATGYFFSRYDSEYDDGLLTKWSGVSEGSKLYYVKLWNENDELIYLGAASTALNPTTNVVENCWRSYYNGTTDYQFAHNSETLSNYQPYGGGTDE